MATEIPIPDSDINPGAIVDSSLMFRMRDNPVAVVEGNGTTKINSNAFADNSLSGQKVAINTTPGDRLLNNSVSAAKLQDGTVSSSKLNLITGTFSGSLEAGASDIINLPQFTLNWSLEGSSNLRIGGKGGASPTNPGFRVVNTGGSPAPYSVHYQAFA